MHMFSCNIKLCLYNSQTQKNLETQISPTTSVTKSAHPLAVSTPLPHSTVNIKERSRENAGVTPWTADISDSCEKSTKGKLFNLNNPQPSTQPCDAGGKKENVITETQKDQSFIAAEREHVLKVCSTISPCF